MNRVLYFDGAAVRQAQNLGELDLAELSWVWVDVDAPSVAAATELGDWLNDAVTEDMADIRLPGRFAQTGDWSMLRLKGLDPETTDLDFGTLAIVAAFSQKLLITQHDGMSVSINAVIESLRGGEKTLTSPLELALAVAERVIGRYLPVIMQLEVRLEELEEHLFAKPSDTLLTEIGEYRLNLKRLRRYVSYHQTALSDLSRCLGRSASDWAKAEIDDIQNTLEREASLTSLYYDLCKDLVDSYISLASHRMNQIMKVLTMVTAVFVPLGFLAGIYGMNFENMPELKSPNGYYILLSVMAALGLGTTALFFRKKWF